MTLRSIAALLVGTLGTLAVAASVALVTTTTALHEASLQLLESSTSITAMQELEAALLLHSQQTTLWSATKDPAHLERRRSAEASLDKWFEVSSQHVGNSYEAELLVTAKKAVNVYLATSAEAERERLDTREIATRVAAASDEALVHLKKLTAENIAQIQDAHVRSARYDEIGDLMGTVVMVLVAGAMVLLLAVFRRQVYQPVVRLDRALRAFRQGRAPAGADQGAVRRGARELVDVATTFAEMATQISKQREDQLRYLAAVAHDLRNPIGALNAGATLALDEFGPILPADVHAMLELMRRQSSLLDRMVADLLDTARAENGQLTLARAAQDLVPIVTDSCELFRSASAAHMLSVHVPNGRVVANVDAARVAQVLNNLISNAIKYSPRGGRVTVRLEVTASDALISVEDTGLGIAAADRESIFEPFRRAASSKDIIPGVGLGLFTARKIVVSHGGRMEVRSKPGCGSTFLVYLPLASTVTAVASAPAETVAPSPPRLQSLELLREPTAGAPIH